MISPPRFRAPAIPLVTHDPSFSIWSTHDELTGGVTTHWSGRAHALGGLVRIDGTAWRFCGAEPAAIPAMRQLSVDITPTATRYAFRAAGIRLELAFLSPLVADDLELLSRPVSYLTCRVLAIDGAEHTVSVHIDASAEISVDHWDQQVCWSRYRLDGLEAVRIGSAEQRVLARSGDDLRIDWGWLYLAARSGDGAVMGLGARDQLRTAFSQGLAPGGDDLDMPRRACQRHPTLACTFDLGRVRADACERSLMIAYDDIHSVEFLGRRLRGYWSHHGRVGFDRLLRQAAHEQEEITVRCRRLDQELLAACEGAGGVALRDLAAISYRQAMSAHKLVQDRDGTPYFLSKENFSNGCIATVDVTFPSSPLFLLTNPALVRAMVEPVLRYAETPAWRFPFAPHDLGTYPLANGQVYGGGESSEVDQMPVEECGNLLILVCAVCLADGSTDFAERSWKLLALWAGYLLELGFDPPNQLCTDDFAGHLSGNCNLSLKAILGIGAFARLCALRGLAAEHRVWRGHAEDLAQRWAVAAQDGGHSRLAFSQAGTWSLKYTLIWDRILDLRLFPDAIARAEVALYLRQLNAYGIPLDSRHTYTTLDHVVWAACLADEPQDAQTILDTCHAYLVGTPDRVPLSDWYDTVTGRRVGFQARSVVGGVFLPLMKDAATWRAWRARRAAALDAPRPGQAVSAAGAARGAGPLLAAVAAGPAPRA